MERMAAAHAVGRGKAPLKASRAPPRHMHRSRTPPPPTPSRPREQCKATASRRVPRRGRREVWPNAIGDTRTRPSGRAVVADAPQREVPGRAPTRRVLGASKGRSAHSTRRTTRPHKGVDLNPHEEQASTRTWARTVVPALRPGAVRRFAGLSRGHRWYSRLAGARSCCICQGRGAQGSPR